MADFPQGICVGFYTRKHPLQVLEDKVFQEGAPVKFVSIYVGDPLGPLGSHDPVEEDVLGDAEVGAVREEPVPRLPDDAAMELPQQDARKTLPQEARHEDVVQPGGGHQDLRVLDTDLGEGEPGRGGGDIQPAWAEVRIHPPRHVLCRNGPLAHQTLQ